MAHLDTIKILSYNIHGGLQRKIKNEEFCSYLNGFHVVCLFETHDVMERSLGRDWITTCVKATKSEAKGRASGGTIVGIKKEFGERIVVMEKPQGIYIKIIVEKGSRCIIPAYINCCNWKPDFENLQNLINSNKLRDFIIIGDLNARIGAFQGTGKHIINDQLRKERISKGPIVNSNGKDLIELIHEQDLVVLNGRTHGDKEGDFTFATRAGQSVNDYCLVEGEQSERLGT